MNNLNSEYEWKTIMLGKIGKFIKNEYDHWLVSRLEQMKFEAEEEIKKLQKLDDGKNERIRLMIQMKENELDNIRVRLSLRKRKKDGLEF